MQARLDPMRNLSEKGEADGASKTNNAILEKTKFCTAFATQRPSPKIYTR